MPTPERPTPQPPGRAERPGRRRARTGPSVAAVLAACALAAGCGAAQTPPSQGGGGQAAATPSPAPSSALALQNDYERVVAQVLPAVVQINTPTGLGSGVLYDNQGDIVTNAHVVGDNTTFTVTLAQSHASQNATLVGVYAPDDLAVVKLGAAPSGLRPASFADSSTVRVGQIVLAMGNPLGLSSSVTEGIVSAVGRTVAEPAGGGSPAATIPNMTQTSAAINPGNSGGALVDLNGRVIGVNTLAAVDQELGGGAAPGIGFAIPSSTITRIADQLIHTGKVTNSGRAALGVTVRTVLSPGGGEPTPAGAGVVAVTAGGPAAAAGLRPGDTIVKLDTADITTAQSLTEALASHSPGQKVQVGYVRGGQNATATVTLGELKTG